MHTEFETLEMDFHDDIPLLDESFDEYKTDEDVEVAVHSHHAPYFE